MVLKFECGCRIELDERNRPVDFHPCSHHFEALSGSEVVEHVNVSGVVPVVLSGERPDFSVPGTIDLYYQTDTKTYPLCSRCGRPFDPAVGPCDLVQMICPMCYPTTSKQL